MPFLIIATVVIAAEPLRSIRIVRLAHVLVVKRLGRFHGIARSGLNILIPYIERHTSIDVLYYRVADPHHAT